LNTQAPPPRQGGDTIGGDKEHINDVKYNKDKAGYWQHILSTQHDFSNDITALEVLEVHPKTPFLNTLERFHIYKNKKFLMNNFLIHIIPFLKFYNLDTPCINIPPFPTLIRPSFPHLTTTDYFSYLLI
jgi:hypothetical protein